MRRAIDCTRVCTSGSYNINADNVKGNFVIGCGDGREKKNGKLRDFGKQFFPGRVKLAHEGINGTGGYNRSGEPVLKRTIFFKGAD